MIKLLSITFTALVLVTLLQGQDFSPAIAPLYTGPNWGTIFDNGATCTGGPNISIVRDDGTYENGYRSVSTGDSTTMVQKMVMPSTPLILVQMCVVWTALAPSGNLTFDLIIYDTTGAGGTAPGNVVYRMNNLLANAVGIFPLHTRYSYPINFTATQRAYFVGVRWNNNPVLPFFSSSDENEPVSTIVPGYQRITTTYPPVWEVLPNATHPNWKNFAIRLEGTSIQSLTGMQITRCRNGLNIVLPDNSIIKDSVLVVLGTGCIITDVNVRIDTFLHTWDSDVSFYLQRGSIGVSIVENAGGSGDNFIGTILNDSATIPIASGTAPFTGSFIPENSLTPLNGTFSSGYFRFAATDTADEDTGLLKAWCVVITYENCFGIQQTIEVPNYYSLGQNYPNPFNPVTNIEFSVPLSGKVKLVVFDILGREAAVLLNEHRNPGVYNVDFDASHLSSGIYFYRLEAGDFVQTKKMLLVK